MTMPNEEESEQVDISEQPTTGVPEQVEFEEVPKSEDNSDPREDMTDIAGITEEDREHLFGTSGTTEIDEEEDLSDLTDVDFSEDVMGVEPEPTKKRYRIVPKGRRVVRLEPPPTSLGGVK